MATVLMKIDSFRYENKFLSNFYPSIIIFEDEVYDTVEAAYQAAKTLKLRHDSIGLFGEAYCADKPCRTCIREAATPARAKQLGKQVQLRRRWNDLRVGFMYMFLKQKFQDPVLRTRLINTKDAELIEGNWWCDLFFGVCTCKIHKGEGANWLGRLLMRVRSNIDRGKLIS